MKTRIQFALRPALLATIRGSIHKLAWCLTVLAIVLGVTGVACAQLAQQILLSPGPNPGQMVKNVHVQLDGHVVGYALAVGQVQQSGLTYSYGNAVPQFADSYGLARTGADWWRGGPQSFGPNTKITVASVSKAVTAIAAVRILGQNGISIDSPIGPYLPSDWNVSPYVANMTFSQLLSQQSGIKDYGNVTQDYQTLKQFFGQFVSPFWNATSCQPANITLPLGTAINPNDMSRCYSNYNFAIFRILLPKVAGYPEDTNLATRPQTLAHQYVQLVQQNVFELVGRYGVECTPPQVDTYLPPGTLLRGAYPAATYAYSYNYPGASSGQDWGDVSLQCGAAGWYLSVMDMFPVLASLAADDGKILSSAQWATMQQRRLGWDVPWYFYTPGELEKNGGWGSGSGQLSTSVAVFGPQGRWPQSSVVAVLFINSDISGGPSDKLGAQNVLEKAYWGWGAGKAYFFSGSQYVEYDFAADKVDSGYDPLSIFGNFPGLWWGGVDAAVNWGNGKVYFFRGSQYMRYDVINNKVDDVYPPYPRNIADYWPSLPSDWASGGIDAAVNWGDGKVYFFRGSQYLSYDIASNQVDVGYPPYPRSIADNFPGFPWWWGYVGVDAAVNWGDGKVYFFKNDLYVKYDIAKNKVVDDEYPLYPRYIAGNWPGFPATFNSGIKAAVNW